MSLSIGTGPFGAYATGVFNFERRGPGAVLFWDEHPKRMRAELDGIVVADSRHVRALHESGHLMKLYFPREDVAMDRLERSERTSECPHKGTARYWSVRAGDRFAQDAAWSYENPLESAAFMAGWIAFEYDAMDAWYQEDERVYAHPRDPYHRYDVHRSSRHVVVRAGGALIAESERPAMLFETSVPPRYYLPPGDVRMELLERSERVTHCPYKGAARHWHVAAGDGRVRHAAWTLPEPIGEAVSIAGWYSFYPGKVEIEVDGGRLAD